MELTKKEIKKQVKSIRKPGFNAGFNYFATVRGFYFETRQDNKNELYEEDQGGKLTFVAYIQNKTDVINAIYSWFKEYVTQEFDKI